MSWKDIASEKFLKGEQQVFERTFRSSFRLLLIFVILPFLLLFTGRYLLFHQNILSFFEKREGLVTIILTLIGWLILFFLGITQQRKLLRDNLRVAAYQEINEAKKELDTKAAELSIHLMKHSFPFIQMEASYIGVDMRIKGVDIGIKKESAAFQDAAEIWNKFKKEIANAKNEYMTEYITLTHKINTWLFLVPSLEFANHQLFIRHNDVSEEISDYITYIHRLNVYDWKKWDRNSMEYKAEKAYESFFMSVTFFHDFLALLKNEMFSSLFSYCTKERTPQIKQEIIYEVLTKKGIQKKKWTGEPKYKVKKVN